MCWWVGCPPLDSQVGGLPRFRGHQSVTSKGVQSSLLTAMPFTEQDALNLAYAYLDEPELVDSLHVTIYNAYLQGIQDGTSKDTRTSYYTGLREGISRYAYYANPHQQANSTQYVGPNCTTRLCDALASIAEEEQDTN